MKNPETPSFPLKAKLAAAAFALILVLGALDVQKFLPKGFLYSAEMMVGLGFSLVVIGVVAYTFWEILCDGVRALHRVFSKKDGS